MIEMPKYKDRISLIPYGFPQLLDYGAPLSILDDTVYYFEEIPEEDEGAAKVYLHAFSKNSEGEILDEMDPSREYEGGYVVKGPQAIQPWLNKWVPLPFLHVKKTHITNDEYKFEPRPANWARARISLDPDDPQSLRLVIAFDMQVKPLQDGGEDAALADPAEIADNNSRLTEADVEGEADFRLAWRFRDNAWFMNLPWVDEWLQELWTDWQKTLGRRARDEWRLEYLAYYLTYLEAIQKISRNCCVYVVRPNNSLTVNVDLILDIGNSRTTGILVENQPQMVTQLNNSYLLQIRDMERPENIYTEPFDTRLEFTQTPFGNEALSQRSGRKTPAFVWPSPVRIGIEAARLAAGSRCGKGSTGLSSPKRYLWDERDWAATWRFNTGTDDAFYVTSGPIPERVNSSGTPLSYFKEKGRKREAFLKQDQDSAFESLFTRSSLMMFLFIEIIEQALMTINSPGQRIRREQANVPRRLQQIIFTVPGGMPIAEQNLYKFWAKQAVEVLWDAMGWKKYYKANPRDIPKGGCDYRTSPIIRCEWDEATCTQLLFLYNEIVQKFRGDAPLFFERLGRPRSFDGKELPSIRIAAIDIGGGTTDLSITTFELASDKGSTPRVVAHPNFHDGFNFAGDDILRAMISEHIFPSLGRALLEAGVPDAQAALKTLFGEDQMDASQEMRNKRIQFVNQLAVPAAKALLSLYERANLRKSAQPVTFKISDCFVKPAPAGSGGKSGTEGAVNPLLDREVQYSPAPMPSAAVLDYIKDYAAKYGGKEDFNILDVVINTRADLIDDSIRRVLKNILSNLCEVINIYDCDALLVTGRPSRWKAIINTLYSLVPLPPGRIFPMNEYKVGGWYPFSDPMGNITDPKTTVVVGAILCALAEGQMEGFSFDANRISLNSTARYIGEMELDGQIKKEKVWFVVEDPNTGKLNRDQYEMEFSGPTPIGFRQLAAERWTTTRFYQMEFASQQAWSKYKNSAPLKVTLEFHVPSKEDFYESQSLSDDMEPDEGEFEIVSIKDKNGEEIPFSPRNPVLRARLQTLPSDAGFWMDTGVIAKDISNMALLQDE